MEVVLRRHNFTFWDANFTVLGMEWSKLNQNISLQEEDFHPLGQLLDCFKGYFYINQNFLSATFDFLLFMQ